MIEATVWALWVMGGGVPVYAGYGARDAKIAAYFSSENECERVAQSLRVNGYDVTGGKTYVGFKTLCVKATHSIPRGVK
jgi:hypothetical protein